MAAFPRTRSLASLRCLHRRMTSVPEQRRQAGRFAAMTIMKLGRNSGNQGRGPGLYDEQLQRQQQEQKLFANFSGGTGRGRLGLGARSAARKPETDGE